MIIGISTDPLDLQDKFTKKNNLPFPLFADTDRKAAKAYGVIKGEAKNASRQTFVIDKKGILRKVYAKVNAANHPAEVHDYIKENVAK